MSKVVHLTSAHTRFHTRIFLKRARSLAAAGCNTSLGVADGQGDGVDILDAGKPRVRLHRTLGPRGVWLLEDLASVRISTTSTTPEMLPTALRCKREGEASAVGQ